MSALLLLVIPLLSASAQSRNVTDAEVLRVHRSSILIDTHNDVTSETVKGLDIGLRRNSGHTDIPRLREGGVGAVFFAAYVASEYVKGNRSAHRALEMIDTIRNDIIGRHTRDLALALTADDIARIRQSGRIAALIGIEGGHAIEDSLRLLRQYYALGVRYMTLTHSNSNSWAGSSGDAHTPERGLTPLGRQVIREMNRLGMMVDISHVSDRTFFDVLETSAAPPLASHSSCRALSNIPRNKTDEMIQALSRKGGVVQVNFGCEFLSQKSADTSSWTNRNYPKGAPTVPAALADVVAHIDHIVKIAGIDHVGIGSDFDGVGCVPRGLADVSRFPALTRALLERGYTETQVRKIHGENLLRVMRAAEQTSHRLGQE